MKLGLKTLLGLTAAVAGLSVVSCKNAASDGGGVPLTPFTSM